MVGSTDAHTGLAAVEEDNFFGKTAPQEPSPERMTKTFVNNPEDRRDDHGLGGRRLRLRRRVGDREHARGDLRRDAAPRDLRHDRPAHDRALLRRLGLRAGGRAQPHARRASATPRACRWAATCSDAPAGKAPTFLVAALKDPIGANLDRIQIVKGWLDAKGETAREGLRRRGLGRPQDRRRRPLQAAGRQHRGRRERDLDQHHRRAGADHGLEGPGVRRRRSARSTTPA